MSKKKGHKKGYKRQKYRKKVESTMPSIGLRENKATLVFKAIDSLFFRESRPMESMGELQSTFPPSVQTLAGAVRTLIGETQQVNWHEFNADHELAKIIGYGDDLGALSFQGAWLAYNGERLFPTPCLLMEKNEEENKSLYRLAISEDTLYCDLGKKVRLPYLPKKAQGSKPLENTWLTKLGLEEILKGKLPNSKHIKRASDIFHTESRVGIARNNAQRTTEEGMLYQTEHIRLNDKLTIELDAAGLPDTLPHSVMVRLGGEGRSAHVMAQQKAVSIHAPQVNKNTQGIILYLVTPLCYTKNTESEPLPSFVRHETETQTIWKGTLNGISLILHSAVTGKYQRDGGWNLAKQQPRVAHSLVPAGSAFFCIAENADHQAAIAALHNTQIGDRTEYGLGHIMTGLWQNISSTDNQG